MTSSPNCSDSPETSQHGRLFWHFQVERFPKQLIYFRCPSGNSVDPSAFRFNLRAPQHRCCIKVALTAVKRTRARLRLLFESLFLWKRGTSSWSPRLLKLGSLPGFGVRGWSFLKGRLGRWNQQTRRMNEVCILLTLKKEKWVQVPLESLQSGPTRILHYILRILVQNTSLS